MRKIKKSKGKVKKNNSKQNSQKPCNAKEETNFGQSPSGHWKPASWAKRYKKT